jgi:hypothetical protein
MPAMDATTLKALLQAEKLDALGIHSGTLKAERSKALDYYMGDVSEDMPVGDGRSQAVSSDVADTVEGLMPALMEIFAGSDEVVRFEPVGIEDEDAAEQETDYTNHVFMQKNPGFLVLYSFIKDALLSKIGVCKVYWDEYEKEERETYLDQPDEVFAALAANPDVEIVEHEERDENGIKLHDVTLVKRKDYGCAKAEAIPPEEFGISKRARSISQSHYCYHEPAGKTEADLIAQGFDAEQVKTLQTQGDVREEEGLARDSVEEGEGDADTLNRAMRPIKVTEHYVRMDYEGDGKARLYRVTTGGDDLVVLKRDGKPDVVPVDVMPFAAMTPVIITHRFFGRSIADLVLDIQRIKTALIRGLLDNIYLLNNQRYEVAESHANERTLDDLLVNRPGGVIRTKTPGGLVPIANQPIGAALFPAIEYMDATREWRTGVTRQGQGLSPDSLQNIGERAVLDQANAARAKTKLIARIFAETGIRDLFSLLHQTIRKNERQASTVRLRNKWVPIDPRNWKTRDDMTITVGLGTGSKDQEVMYLMQLLGIQREAIMAPETGLVEPKNIYNTLEKIVQRVGLKSIEPYFTDPDTNPKTGQARPDPKMEEAKAKLEIEKEKAGAQIQLEQTKAQVAQQSDAQKMQTDMLLKREQMTAEFQLKREQMMAELQLRREEMMLEAELKREQGFYRPKAGGDGISDTQMGGQVG